MTEANQDQAAAGGEEQTQGQDQGAAAAAPAPTPAAAAPAPAAKRAAAKGKPEKDLVDTLLDRKDGDMIRVIAPKGRLGDALQPEVVYGPTVGTKRRIADLRSNPWLQRQLRAGVLVLESDTAE